MLSTVLKQIISAAALSLVSLATAADSSPPKVLREPIFGLRYEVARAHFDRLPPQALANCGTLLDNQYSRAVWYIYARTIDASGRTYYVVSGFEVRNGVPPHLRYETDGLGVLFFTDRGSCTILDIPRQIFDDRSFTDELSQQTLRELAADSVRRLERAFGGTEHFRAELRNQHVIADGLPPELRAALQPYLR